jgi:hypothetical protein
MTAAATRKEMRRRHDEEKHTLCSVWQQPEPGTDGGKMPRSQGTGGRENFRIPSGV